MKITAVQCAAVVKSAAATMPIKKEFADYLYEAIVTRRGNTYEKTQGKR